jgi:outer membrane protein TolC
VLELQHREAMLALKGLMGLAPAADVRLLPALALSQPSGSSTQPDRPALEHHPKMRLAKAEYAVAERTLDAEIRKQHPDLTIGAGPGTEEGDRRVLFGLGLPLPIFNANQRAIAEARAARDVAGAAAEATYEELVGELARARVNEEIARIRIGFLESELVPLVDEQLNDARRLARLGEFQALVSLEAHTRAFETKLEVLEARLKQAQGVSQLQTLLHAGHAPDAETQP